MHNRTRTMALEIQAMSDAGMNTEQIASEINTNPSTIKSIIKKGKQMPRKPADWRALVEHANTGKEFFNDADITQKYSEVSFDTNKPIAVVYTGDWHLGDRYINYDLWRKHIETIMDNDNVFMIALGDEYQNARAFKNLSMVLEQALSPNLQLELLNSLFDELITKQKLLAKVLGNHDAEFDDRIYGQKLMGFSDKIATIPIFSNRGILDIRVGEQSYSNLLFHKSRFRSFIRPAHGAFREWQMSYPAEIVAGGHDHVPSVEIMYNRDAMGNEKEVYLIKVGTYQESEFGWKYFHNGGPMTPTVVYFPLEHKKTIFTSIEDALQFMKGYK